jgi:tetratricopeptide (TPR) repeat protein
MSALQTARTGEGTLSLTEESPAAPSAAARATILDPPLYLGAIYLRQGQAKEALRYLTEANRLDGNCPIVTCQLATAMIAAGGDTQLAIRALQRGLRGLGQWRDNPHAAWREALPEQRSYVRKLADKHAFTCPLWGTDLRQIARQGETALGQALYRLGQFKESADIFGKLMQDAAPTLPVLRGYGLALARIGNYDEAFKHLRAAHELDDKDRLVAGYLALCGAKGKPAQEGDKPRNVLWAIRLVSEFTAPGDAEWANLVSAIFAEARALNLPLERDDQLYLCEHLLSVRAADPQAADSYHHLQASYPQVVTREYAWLYCRAAQQHNVSGAHALELFARTFADPASAREFYEAQGWSFDDVESTYLERAAALRPGAFPEALGPSYARRGEELLLARSLRQADAGQLDAARASAHTLLKLSPHNAAAHDRLAMLCHRQQDDAAALEILRSWSVAHPHDPAPVVRQAIVHEQAGDSVRCGEMIRAALALSGGRRRARIALLGARLLLKKSPAPKSGALPDDVAAVYRQARDLLEDSLSHDPAQADATWLLAAVRYVLGDRAGLASQSSGMDRPEVADARFHYLAGVCHLAAENYGAALDACQRSQSAGQRTNGAPHAANGAVAPDSLPFLNVETAYVAGWAHARAGNVSEALQSLRKAAHTADSPSAAHARALLGRLAVSAGANGDAVQWWQGLDPSRRLAWRLNETLAGTIFLGAVEAYRDGRYEQAAERFREAGRLGWRDRRLGSLLVLALVKAGQRYLYHPLEQLK